MNQYVSSKLSIEEIAEPETEMLLGPWANTSKTAGADSQRERKGKGPVYAHCWHHSSTLRLYSVSWETPGGYSRQADDSMGL
jgi:hypothetical protein